MKRERTGEILAGLDRLYPKATCALEFQTPFQLLIATILAAQSTDARVNLVTKDLFKKYPDVASLAAADPSVLEKDIHATGFFRNKAKSVLGASMAILEKHGGEVPKTIEALVELPGVGRKTANVVLGTALGINAGVVVDTHVSRVSARLSLTEHSDPVKIEQDLMSLIPKKKWTKFSHQLILHGRTICIARKPKCSECMLNELCPSAEATLE